MIKGILVLSKPLLRDPAWMSYFNGSAAAGEIDHEMARDRLQPLADRGVLLHPNFAAGNAKSVEVFLDRSAGQSSHARLQFSVSSPEHADYLRRVGGINLLCIPSGSIDDEVLVVRWCGDERYYRRWQLPQAEGICLHPYCLYLGIDKDKLGATDLAQHRVDIKVEPGIPGSQESLWLNPFFLELPAKGNELQLITDGAGSGLKESTKFRTDVTVGLLAGRENLLDVVPVVERKLAARIMLLKELEQRIRRYRQARPGAKLSMAESLMFGTASGAIDWQPFFCLDLLQGEFYMMQDSKGNLQRYWSPVEPLSSNELWLAEYWLERWGGTLKSRPANFRVMAPRRPAQGRIFRPARVIPDRVDTSYLFRKASDSLHAIYQYDDGVTSGSDAQIIKQFVAPILEKGLWDNDTRNMLHCPFIFERDAGKYSFDETGFLEEYAREFFAPISSVYIQIYSQGLGLHGDSRAVFQDRTVGLNMDLVDSPFQGARRMFRKLVLNLEVEKAGGLRLKNEHGWWEIWYDALFSHSSDVRLDFDPRTDSAELSKARLGHFQLGCKLKAYEQPHTVAV